ncbi:MAG: hypothetical protein KDE19_14370, partial [Caldilineaceae bacterium]|nr:hypothetical protein [Caldilineaceae bacterium]
SGKVAAPTDLPATSYKRDIDDEWEIFRRYSEQRKQLSEQKVRGTELEQQLADRKPRADWTVATYLGDYRMQAQAIHNTLVETWLRANQALPGLNVQTLLTLFADFDADKETAAAAWKAAAKGSGLDDTVTASQLFNPHMGKGQNRAKANGLAMGNEKNFWLLDYLKAVGLWLAAAPRNATNADLRKTYILAPRALALNHHQEIFNRFRDRLWNSSSVKLDVMAALLYVETLLAYVVEAEQLAILQKRSVSNLVAGMHVSTYQLLSQNSYTMMNLAFLGLPDWLPTLASYADAQRYQAIVREHIERLQAIEEEKSEGHTLLQRYRDFVSGNDLQRFFAFHVGYGNYLISALERSNYYVKPFGEENLERLISMSQPKLTPILQNQGFRNVAEAIRRSTVIPQYIGRKMSNYDVRYGLGQELKRKAQYADDFIQELAAFMQSYNEENARVHERTKGESRRKAITTDDIQAVVELIDEYGAETICNLLIAFGYARDPKEQAPPAETQPTDETAV